MTNLQTVNSAVIPSDVRNAVHKQWATRPSDERFADLGVLKASVAARRSISVTEDVDVKGLHFQTVDGQVVASSPTLGLMAPTHWAFGQAASLVGAPGAYLRKLPAQLAADCLNHGIAERDTEGVKLYAADGEEACQLRAVTSQTYGRIWDIDVVEACERIVEGSGGRFESPWAWGKQHRALFASDRDVFLFFCDGGSIVDGGGDRDQLHRGFYVYNSEVGSTVFGLAAFLFRSVCGNFLITDMQAARILRIRHSSGGPARFVEEAIPALTAYVEQSAQPMEATVQAAKAYLLPAKEDEMFTFFLKNGFTKAEVRRAKQFAETEEGQFASLWDGINGMTASARMMAYADAGADLSRRAGKLLEIVKQ